VIAISPLPPRGLILSLLDCFKDVLSEPIVADRSIVAFDIRVLFWLTRSGVLISMDRKGRFIDNIFVKRLWRSLKREFVYLQACKIGSEAGGGITKRVAFYNHKSIQTPV
jgi:putative transposase